MKAYIKESKHIIKRDNGSSVFLQIVSFIERKPDGLLYARILLLDMETYGTDENDIDVAIDELIRCYVRVCDRYGQGLEKELRYLE